MKAALLAVLAVVAVNAACLTVSASAEEKPAQVIAYYFHGAFRCPTCTSMERYSREALDAGFQEALASGRLVFKAVNVEEKENEHFAGEYQLYTKALILSLVQDGKEVRYKNLDKIWKLSRNKDAFIEYVTAELDSFMKGAR